MTMPQNLPRRAHPDEVKLEAAGKGLPWFEHLISRFWILPRFSRKMSWESCDQQFDRESKRILTIYQLIPEQDRDVRVLVPRLRGLEDSSRFWSAAMVLEHLVIVGTQMATVISELSQGRTPQGKADVAKVKPLGNMSTDEAMSQFEAFVAAKYHDIRQKITNQDSQTRFEHPWFGPITARQWHWLIGSHHYIHRKQLEQIVKGLNEK